MTSKPDKADKKSKTSIFTVFLVKMTPKGTRKMTCNNNSVTAHTRFLYLFGFQS